jgi:FKBP-type peptidyl-prolyl cis-trans isomerase (trigger factor)
MPEITDEELTAFQAQAAKVEGLAAQIETLTAQAAEVDTARNEVRQATDAARAAIIAANPAIPADLIQGESIAQIEQSLATAQAIANRLTELAGKGPLGFPTGGTQRQPASAPEGIRSAERIRWALNNKE